MMSDSFGSAVKSSVAGIVGRGRHERLGRDRGVEANARLTATAGLVVLVMLAAEGATLLSVHRWLSWHVGIGLAVAPPIVLKFVSTFWRFTRYYSGDPRYRASGPPHPLLRVVGPFVILTTGAVIGTGIGLWLQGPGSAFGFWHRACFIIWIPFMTVHVLAHTLRALRLVSADSGPYWLRRRARYAPWTRRLSVVAAAGVGIAAALLALHVSGLRGWSDFHHFGGRSADAFVRAQEVVQRLGPDRQTSA